MDWDDVRYFLALARSGSVRAAGEALGVSHSTVSRRVDSLETQLGVRLFDRHRDGYLLTDAGQQMVPGAERVEREMSELERTLAGRDARLAGPIRVTCTDAFVGAMLVGALGALCAEHPELELELDADARNLNLSKREADVAVRALAVGASPPEHLIGRKLVPITLCSYVSVRHADRLDPGVPGSEPRWLGSDRRRVMETLLSSSSYPDLPVWGAFASMDVMRAAAHEGLGLAMLPTYVGDADRELRRLHEPDLRHLADFWLLSHPDLRDNARLSAARECVVEALGARAALFEGRRSDAPLRSDSARHGEHGSPVG